jgi:hypothetical protein
MPSKQVGRKAASRPRKASPQPPRRKSAARAGSIATADKIAGISSEAVEKGTGRTWDYWLKTLDKDGAKALSHKQIAELLHTKHEVAPWWSQMVTVGYEQARGLREVNQKTDGYSVSVSRVVGAPLGELYAAWKDARRRAQWLGETGMTIRKATADKSMRITWSDGKTSVEANFYAKAADRSQVAVQHNKLTSQADVDRLRKFWGERLDALKSLLAETPKRQHVKTPK